MLPHADRLPMQFSLTGHAGWSAPRMVALAFLPALAFVTMLGVGFIPAQQGLREAQGISAVSFILGHLFYLWLLRRHLR
ncbi:hypothetical protein [Thalassovita sp. S70]|uniref:hypothetical protein n=1 Tax=Thalassovita sp. S70 TaxID=3415123 RepID=UPI003C7B6552